MKPVRDLISSRVVSFLSRQGCGISSGINFSLRALLASWLILGQVLSLATVGLAERNPADSQIISLGILDFQNESGLNVSPDLVRKITQELRRRFISNHKDVLPRSISAGGDSPADTMTIEQLATLGRQYGAGFVIRGGLLGLVTENDGEGTIVRAQLYADVISVESADITTLRAEGVGALDDASASADANGGLFGYSAQERALSSAIEQLASAIHQSFTQAPVADEQAMDSAGGAQENAQADPVAPRGADEAEADEDLRRLIAQANELISSGAARPELLESLSQALEKLKAALTLKATLLEEGKDTGEADREISARREELRSAISANTEKLPSGETSTPDTEDLPSGEASASDTQQSSGDGRSPLARVNEYLSEMSSIIQKIQEIRASFRDARREAKSEGTIPAGEGGERTLPAEEEAEEVSGAVTEPGAPVEGAVVTKPELGASATTGSKGFVATKPESGASATTGSSGSYKLKGAPVGKLVDLTIQKNGKKLDPRRVEPPLSAQPDFGLKAKSSKADQTGPIIIPSVVKTDSRGRYTSINVPAGANQPVVRTGGLKLKSEKAIGAGREHAQPIPHVTGLKPKPEKAIVTVKQINQSKSVLVSSDRISKPPKKTPAALVNKLPESKSSSVKQGSQITKQR